MIHVGLIIGLLLWQEGSPPAVAPHPIPAAREPALRGVRNVLLVVVDTLRADHLGCYGYPRATSPGIDGLARAGVRFEQCYTAWPETCESMAAMLSGLYCQTNGVVVDTPQCISSEMEFLPERLKAAGMQTAAFVTNGNLSAANHYDQGFGENYFQVWDNTQHGGQNETELAIRWLVAHGKEAPFFVWVHYLEPHSPYTPKEPRRFVGDALYDPARKAVVNEGAYDAIDGFPAFSLLKGVDERDYYVASYDSEIVDSDRKIQRLLATLDREGLSDSTLVIFTADHGEGFGEHRYYWHGGVPYDETAHVPLVVRATGLGPGVVKKAVSTVDLAPTILDALGLPKTESYEGESLLPSLRDPAGAGDHLVFTESGRMRHGQWQRSIRDSRWKLIYVPSRSEQRTFGIALRELYDIEHDPGETKNLLEERPDVALRLDEQLLAWIRPEPRFQSTTRELGAEDRKTAAGLGYVAAGNEEPAPTAVAPINEPFPHVNRVVLVLVDALRADHLPAFGYGRATMPVLNRIATTRSVLFTNAYTPWPTAPPAVAAVLSGRCLTGAAGDGRILADAIETLPELLGRAGWLTACFTGHPQVTAAHGFAQGFDDFVNVLDPAANPERRPEADLACQWLDDHGKAGPFLLVVHLTQPGAPWTPRKLLFTDDALYDPGRKVEVRGPDRAADAVGGIPGLARVEGESALAHYVARYDSELVDTDRALARLLKKLGELDVDPQTLFIVAGTHGTGFGEHNYYASGLAPWDETTHVPLVVKVAGSAMSRRSDDLVTLVDLKPTILEILGQPPALDSDGISLAEHLKTPLTTATLRLVFCTSGADGSPGQRQQSARTRSWKLVHMPSERERALLGLDEVTLYDLRNDPGETHNVAAAHPEITAFFLERLRARARGE